MLILVEVEVFEVCWKWKVVCECFYSRDPRVAGIMFWVQGVLDLSAGIAPTASPHLLLRVYGIVLQSLFQVQGAGLGQGVPEPWCQRQDCGPRKQLLSHALPGP